MQFLAGEDLCRDDRPVLSPKHQMCIRDSVSAKIVDVDVFSLLPDDDVAWCNFVRIRHGSVVGVQTVKLSTGVGGDERDMLTLAIQHIVENIAGGELSREVIVPLLPSTTLLFEGVTFTVPKRGEKLELLEFSRKSARIYRACLLYTS